MQVWGEKVLREGGTHGETLGSFVYGRKRGNDSKVDVLNLYWLKEIQYYFWGRAEMPC